MNTENLPQIQKDNIFKKIKNYFFKFINKNKVNKIEPIIMNEHSKNILPKDNFRENIKEQTKSDILYLQNKLKLNEAKISDLTDEQLDEMISLYKEQIEEKENQLRSYRKKISSAS